MEKERVVVLDPPVRTDYLDWLIAHPECDAIIEDADTQHDVYVYAYATSLDANDDLKKMWKKDYKGKHVMGGLSRAGVRMLS